MPLIVTRYTVLTLQDHSGLSRAVWRGLLSDGRVQSPLITRMLADLPGNALARDGRSGLLVHNPGGFWRVRLVTDRVAFSPPKCRGVGRSVGWSSVDEALAEVEGFLLADSRIDLSGPHVQIPVYSVTREALIHGAHLGLIDDRGYCHRSEVFPPTGVQENNEK